MKSQKGITLVALVITIVLAIILASVSVNVVMEPVKKTRLQGFYTELEIIQKRVDDIATTNETYYIVDNGGSITTVELKKAGSDITEEQKEFIQGILKEKGVITTADQVGEFRYFSVDNLEKQLDLIEMKYDVFIDFENRIVIAEDGIEIGNETYYMLENKTYFPRQNENKNKGAINGLEYGVVKYGTDKYKVTVIPKNVVGDLDRTGYVKYKKETSKYWETSDNTEIIVELDTEYNIQYIDNNNNIAEETIIVIYTEENGELKCIKKEEISS